MEAQEKEEKEEEKERCFTWETPFLVVCLHALRLISGCSSRQYIQALQKVIAHTAARRTNELSSVGETGSALDQSVTTFSVTHFRPLPARRGMHWLMMTAS